MFTMEVSHWVCAAMLAVVAAAQLDGDTIHLLQTKIVKSEHPDLSSAEEAYCLRHFNSNPAWPWSKPADWVVEPVDTPGCKISPDNGTCAYAGTQLPQWDCLGSGSRKGAMSWTKSDGGHFCTLPEGSKYCCKAECEDYFRALTATTTTTTTSKGVCEQANCRKGEQACCLRTLSEAPYYLKLWAKEGSMITDAAKDDCLKDAERCWCQRDHKAICEATPSPAPSPPSPAPSPGGATEDGVCHGTEDISEGTDEYDSPCFDADTGFGPDFSCATTEMWCGHDSGDGLVVGQCCPQKCKKECENKNKNKNEEGRKKAERERKEKRKANEEKRKKAEKERKTKRKETEWTNKRDEKKKKNAAAEDERKTKRKWDKKKKKKERKWKKGQKDRKEKANKREKKRKQERAKKESNNKNGQSNTQKEKAKKEKRKTKKQSNGPKEKAKKEKRKKKKEKGKNP